MTRAPYKSVSSFVQFQSTPSTRRVTQPIISENLKIIISIHTLHTEGDRQHRQHAGLQILISIHTLHTEGDSVRSGLFGPQHNFNPHPPHGG